MRCALVDVVQCVLVGVGWCCLALFVVGCVLRVACYLLLLLFVVCCLMCVVCCCCLRIVVD